MTYDESDAAIAELEKQLGDLETLLDSAIGKQADGDRGEDGADDGTDASEIAELQAEVSKLDRTSRDAITKYASGGFEQVCADIQKRDQCSRTEALTRARTEAPDQFRQYQMAGIELAKAGPAQDRISCPSAFDAAVEQIVRSKKVPRHIAMQLARKDDPALFKAYEAGA